MADVERIGPGKAIWPKRPDEEGLAQRRPTKKDEQPKDSGADESERDDPGDGGETGGGGNPHVDVYV